MTTLQDIFLNKRVLVKVPERDNFGKKIPGKFVDAGGICTFIGVNELLKYDLQITIGRTPFKVNHINDIKLLN